MLYKSIKCNLPKFCDIPFFLIFHFSIIVLLVGQRTPLEISPWALMGYPSTNNVLSYFFLEIFVIFTVIIVYRCTSQDMICLDSKFILYETCDNHITCHNLNY